MPPHNSPKRPQFAPIRTNVTHQAVIVLYATGLESNSGFDTACFASAASARRVVQQPSIISCVQLRSGYEESGERELFCGLRKGRQGEVGGLSPACSREGVMLPNSMHCLTRSSIPFSNLLALVSKSFHRSGPQKGSSSSARLKDASQNSNIGSWEVLFCCLVNSEKWQATSIIRTVGSDSRAWLTTQATDSLAMHFAETKVRLPLTRTASCHTPILLFRDKTLKPRKGATCFTSKDQLEVEYVAFAPQPFC